MRVRPKVSQLHYWSGWALGILALSWFASGFFMTLKPIGEVRGEYIAAEPASSVPPGRYVLGEVPDGASVSMVAASGGPAFVVQTGGVREVRDARTGVPMPPPSEAEVRARAAALLKTDAAVIRAERLEARPRDYGGPVPVWRLTLDAPPGARLYVDAATGRLQRVRTRHWRAFDVAWRIHILDPGGERISSAWLTAASGAAVLFALSGLVLLWRPRRRRR